MNLTLITRALLLALPLAACASERPQTDPEVIAEVKVETSIEAPLPEVRYYVVADT